jgi:hypothetical protein
MKKIFIAFGFVLACGSSVTSPAPTTISMDFTRASSFYDAPFPSEDLRTADGHIDLTNFPAQDEAMVIGQAVALVARDARGFSSTAGVFFSATAPIDPTTLPDLSGSTADGASAYLMDADETSPTYRKKIPAAISYDDDGGPFGAQHQITILPYQGIPLRAKTRYAAVITSAVRDALGRPLSSNDAMSSLAAGAAPNGVSPAALAEMEGAMTALGADASSVVGLAVYRTDDPLAGMAAVLKDALARVPTPNAAFTANEVFDDYCVYSTTIDMPDYQTAPDPQDGETQPYAFAKSGGQWTFDASGNAIFQRNETANVVVTIPRAPMPANGFPTVVFSRTGAGGDRPLVDRGVQPATGQGAVTPGTGPALEFARAGFAGISIDGPLGGLRNPTGDPNQEDFLIFNISNPGAIRDNIRQSGMELALTAHILDALTVDASACPTVANASVKFDVTKLALMGHSMGATISPLSAAFEPRFGAVVLSGCGGSFIENVLYKELPVLIRPLAELLIGYSSQHLELTEGDAALSLVQWAAEAADPPTYGARILDGSGAPHDVLMFQGIVDHYIMPPMANASTLSFGLDVAGTPIDSTAPSLADFTPIEPLLSLSSRSVRALPVSSNVAIQNGNVTAVVTQWASDGIEDGHEIMFQRPEPKYQYRCFLASYAAGGAAIVPVGLTNTSICPF